MSNAGHLQNLGSEKTTYAYDNPTVGMLETFQYEAHAGTQLVGFQTDEFTSLCPKTGQPDFANIDIAYIPRNKGVESKSLKMYLFSYRNHGSFHEDCISQMLAHIVEIADPLYCRVIGDFTRRGGIAIKPMSEYTASDYKRPDSLIEQYDRFGFKR